MEKNDQNLQQDVETVAEVLHAFISHYESYHSQKNETVHMDVLYKLRIQLQDQFPDIS